MAERGRLNTRIVIARDVDTAMLDPMHGSDMFWSVEIGQTRVCSRELGEALLAAAQGELLRLAQSSDSA